MKISQMKVLDAYAISMFDRAFVMDICMFSNCSPDRRGEQTMHGPQWSKTSECLGIKMLTLRTQMVQKT